MLSWDRLIYMKITDRISLRFDFLCNVFTLVSDLAQPPDDFDGEVDMDHFWESLSMDRIGRGFVTSNARHD